MGIDLSYALFPISVSFPLKPNEVPAQVTQAKGNVVNRCAGGPKIRVPAIETKRGFI